MIETAPDHICISDISKLFFKLKKKLFFSSLIFAFFIVFLILLFSPSEYEIKASFNEGLFKEQPSSFKEFLGINVSSIKGNGASSVMLSRKVLKPTIEQLGLQIEEEGSIFKNFSENIFGKKSKEFSFANVRYKKEKANRIKLRFLTKDKFVILKNKKIFEGELNKPFLSKDLDFTLVKAPKDLELNHLYSFTLFPLEGIIPVLEKKIKIVPKKDNKSILLLSLKCKGRHLGADILNVLMQEYRNYLKKENDLLAREEFAYLQKKQEELTSKLLQNMEEYTTYLSQNLSEKGFMTLDWEMNSLITPHNEYLSKLFDIDLELKRLKGTDKDLPCFMDDSFSSKKLQKISGDVSSLRSEKDILSLGLAQKVQENPKDRLESVDQRVKKIDLEIQNLKNNGSAEFVSGLCGEKLKGFQLQKDELSSEKKEILSSLHEDGNWIKKRNLDLENIKNEKEKTLFFINELSSSCPNSVHLSDALFNNLVKDWGKDAFLDKEKKEDLKRYLNEHLHLLDIKENMLKETYVSLDNEFEGLSLESSKDLYVKYNLELDKIKLSINELLHLKEKLNQSNFELSSLSLVLSDPVSLEIIKKAGQLSLDLQDEKNRSDKDIMRLKSELEVEKKFLNFHLEEMVDLKNINLCLVKEKLLALKKAVLFNLNQKISLLNAEASDFVEQRVKNLEEEKKLLLEKTHDLRDKMVDLPTRWKIEKLLQIKTEMALNIMKATTDLLESKTIQHHLEQIQSKPLDEALPPTDAKKPKIVLFFFLSFFCFYFFIFVFYFIKNAIKGFPVSLDYLKSINQHVSGFISKKIENLETLSLSDLETLRTLSSFLDFPKNLIALIGNNGPDYSDLLAELISKKNRKILLVKCDFTKDQNGFLQFFQKKMKQIPIETKNGYDLLLSGGTSNFSTEVLNSSDFKNMIDALSQKYDDIILFTPSKLFLSEAKSFLKYSNKIIVTIKDETMEELKPYFNFNNKNDCRYLTFIAIS